MEEAEIQPLDALSLLSRRFRPRQTKRSRSRMKNRSRFMKKNLPAHIRSRYLNKKQGISRSSKGVARIIQARMRTIRRMKGRVSPAKLSKMRAAQRARYRALRTAHRGKMANLRSKGMRLAVRSRGHNTARAQLTSILRASQEGKISPVLANQLAKKRIMALKVPNINKIALLKRFARRSETVKATARQELVTERQMRQQKMRVQYMKMRDQRLRAREMYKANVIKAKATLKEQQEVLARAVKNKVISPALAQKIRTQQVATARKGLAPVPKQILKTYPVPVTFTREKKVIIQKPPLPPQVKSVPQKTVIIVPMMTASKIMPKPIWEKPSRSRDVEVVNAEARPIPEVKVIDRPAEKATLIKPENGGKIVKQTVAAKPDIISKIIDAFKTFEIPSI